MFYKHLKTLDIYEHPPGYSVVSKYSQKREPIYKEVEMAKKKTKPTAKKVAKKQRRTASKKQN